MLGGRYRVTRMVSAGAATLIVDAEDTELGRPVTVKLVRPEWAESTEFRRTFRQTMRAMSTLSHPNIAAIHDWGEETVGKRTTVYAVVEYLAGGSLRDLFDRGRYLDPSQALMVGLEACRGLDFAHRKGLVHTELTPSKLVFGDDRRLRIVDFGLARLLGRQEWAEPATVATHVARYASPEQALAQPLDGKTDVYSLALILVEAVTRQVPFAARSTVATLSARIGRLMPVSADLGPLAAVLEKAGPAPGRRSLDRGRARPGPRAGGREAAPPVTDPDPRRPARSRTTPASCAGPTIRPAASPGPPPTRSSRWCRRRAPTARGRPDADADADARRPGSGLARRRRRGGRRPALGRVERVEAAAAASAAAAVAAAVAADPPGRAVAGARAADRADDAPDDRGAARDAVAAGAAMAAATERRAVSGRATGRAARCSTRRPSTRTRTASAEPVTLPPPVVPEVPALYDGDADLTKDELALLGAGATISRPASARPRRPRPRPPGRRPTAGRGRGGTSRSPGSSCWRSWPGWVPRLPAVPGADPRGAGSRRADARAGRGPDRRATSGTSTSSASAATRSPTRVRWCGSCPRPARTSPTASRSSSS